LWPWGWYRRKLICYLDYLGDYPYWDLDYSYSDLDYLDWDLYCLGWNINYYIYYYNSSDYCNSVLTSLDNTLNIKNILSIDYIKHFKHIDTDYLDRVYV
jgi:hypothetical protein